LTVITNNLAVINDLSSERTKADVVAVGGQLRSISQGFVGPLAEAVLERLHADVAFIGADAITRGGDICEVDAEQIRLKEIMARRTDKVYVLAHGAKLGQVAPASLPIPLDWSVITDEGAPGDVVIALRSRGIEVRVVSPAR
jgi:DeoR/GlpR family transcriptional regulator of sugar metabolism